MRRPAIATTLPFVLSLAGVLACSGSGGPSAPPAEGGVGDAATDGSVDSSRPIDAGPPPCVRTPAVADRDRLVVVSYPYDAASMQDTRYRVLRLDPAGALTATPAFFSMGRATGGTIEFTPDGEIGVVAQTDGTLGVFRVDPLGRVTVLHTAYDGGFFAESVTMDPVGSGFFGVQPDMDNPSRAPVGGIYRVDIACDGALRNRGKVVATSGAHGFAFTDASAAHAVIAAGRVLGSPPGDEVHLVALDAPARLISSARVFPDALAIVESFAVTHDGLHVLVGDTAAFSGVPNRVAVASVGATLAPAQVLEPIRDPIAIIPSPFDDLALVVSGFGDAIYVLPYAAAMIAAPFGPPTELSYVPPPMPLPPALPVRPQLPSAAAMVARGPLMGRVLVAENQGVRQVQLSGGGVATDLGLTLFGRGTDFITGAIGVTP